MSFNITEILEKLRAIEGFANKVVETKRLADELAETLARLKIEVSKTINDSFSQIADQIEMLRRNMEMMESVQTSPQPTPPPAEKTVTTQARAPTTPAAGMTTPTAVHATPQPSAPVTKPTPAAATPAPTPTPAPTSAAKATEIPRKPEPVDEELAALLQKKDKLKAQLTDVRFDYMRGYIAEAEYKEKEAELDRMLEELEREIASRK
ncbi:MAG: hypothetical protein QXS20_02540 [Candidatus Thorarchaeota archaeon]